MACFTAARSLGDVFEVVAMASGDWAGGVTAACRTGGEENAAGAAGAVVGAKAAAGIELTPGRGLGNGTVFVLAEICLAGCAGLARGLGVEAGSAAPLDLAAACAPDSGFGAAFATDTKATRAVAARQLPISLRYGVNPGPRLTASPMARIGRNSIVLKIVKDHQP
jgi:hypothetical protein